jgi:dephospho-CoA kinase
MYLIGLTGGIASGKSVVASRLAAHGAIIIDADVIAREVVEPGTAALRAIAEEFGSSVITPDGALDRASLGAIIFPNPERRRALDAITHPAVWRRTQELFEEARKRDPRAVVVNDVPLLAEAVEERRTAFDLIVVVQASIQTRIERLVNLRGMSRDEVLHRLNSQATDAERLAIADVVIDSDGTLESTLEQTDELWSRALASAISKQGS